MLVYKILERREWEEARAAGVYAGSNDDRRDGFIHLSTAMQVAGTLQRHFAGVADLVVVAFDAAALGASLRYERSHAGEPYPHLYADLDPADAVWARPVEPGEDGGHMAPDLTP